MVIPLSPVEKASVLDSLNRAIQTHLSYRESWMVKLRHAINDGYVYTDEEVGRIFKTSSSNVRRIDNRARNKLAEPCLVAEIKRQLGIYTFSPQSESTIIQVARICETELLDFLAKHPNCLHGIDSRTFEEIVSDVMHSFGFNVELTQTTRDGGRDIVAVRKDEFGIDTKYIVECKRYAAHRPIRVELVRALYGVKQQQAADHAILATTSYFTRDAIKFSQSPNVWNLHLKDLNEVADWLGTSPLVAQPEMANKSLNRSGG